MTGQAGDGEEALKLCRSLKPDLVISDIKMPGLDGIHMLEAVKRSVPKLSVFLSVPIRILNTRRQPLPMEPEAIS